AGWSALSLQPPHRGWARPVADRLRADLRGDRAAHRFHHPRDRRRWGLGICHDQLAGSGHGAGHERDRTRGEPRGVHLRPLHVQYAGAACRLSAKHQLSPTIGPLARPIHEKERDETRCDEYLSTPPSGEGTALRLLSRILLEGIEGGMPEKSSMQPWSEG